MPSQAEWKSRIRVCAQALADGNHKPIDALCDEIVALASTAKPTVEPVQPKEMTRPATPDRNPHDVLAPRAPMPASTSAAPAVPAAPAVQPKSEESTEDKSELLRRRPHNK